MGHIFRFTVYDTSFRYSWSENFRKMTVNKLWRQQRDGSARWGSSPVGRQSYYSDPLQSGKEKTCDSPGLPADRNLFFFFFFFFLRRIRSDYFASGMTNSSFELTKAKNRLATPWISVKSSSFPASFGGIIANNTLAMGSHHFSRFCKQLIK